MVLFLSSFLSTETTCVLPWTTGNFWKYQVNLIWTFDLNLNSVLRWFIWYDIVQVVSSASYAKTFLENLGMSCFNCVLAPLQLKWDLKAPCDEKLKLNKGLHNTYLSLIGGLSYVTTCTCPFITFLSSPSPVISKINLGTFRPTIGAPGYWQGKNQP